VIAIGHADAGALSERISRVSEAEGDRVYLDSVGLRVRLFRMARSMSQDELARGASVSRVTLGSIERGDHAAGLLTYLKLARALGRDVGELLADGEVLPPRR
jgi:transcriptional regulator with XRE-family HTH domain